MTKIYIVKDTTRNKYFMYINDLGMGELESSLAERFINRYTHVKPETMNDAMQWTYTNP